jgi:hypothetical protein
MHRAAIAVLLSGLAQSSLAAAPVQCMQSVLHKLPSVSHIKSGVTSTWGQIHPFVQYYYSASGPAWRSGNVRFVGSNDGTFTATINGLFTPGTQPADYGTRAVVEQWQLACKVKAYVYSE